MENLRTLTEREAGVIRALTLKTAPEIEDEKSKTKAEIGLTKQEIINCRSENRTEFIKMLTAFNDLDTSKSTLL